MYIIMYVPSTATNAKTFSIIVELFELEFS